jgi:hypothetical protein
MNGLWSSALFFLVFAPGQALARDVTPTLDAMPEGLETRFALSALPPALRDDATVYLLDPATGYRPAREGTSGVACLVERTQWELGAFRDDLFVPLCYDAAGASTYLRAIIDTAALRARGEDAATVKATIAGRFREGTYVPARTGVSYMYAPVMRTLGPPDLQARTMPTPHTQLRTMAMPHLMVYAPGVTNADLGAKPDLGNLASLRFPFIDRQGIDAHSYVIVLAGEAETARILVDEAGLVRDLCAWREVLCLPPAMH